MLMARPQSQEAQVSSDEALIERARAGESVAFGELVRRHDDKMRGVVWRVVESRSEMDDVLQDAYVKAWRALEGFRGDAAFSSWLYRIVYTTAIDHVRATARHRHRRLDDVVEPFTVDPTAAIADSHVLRAALAELPPDQLAVVTLVEGQGLSYDDVAQLLDISPGTVGSRLSRARAQLRTSLRPTGNTDDSRGAQ